MSVNYYRFLATVCAPVCCDDHVNDSQLPSTWWERWPPSGRPPPLHQPGTMGPGERHILTRRMLSTLRLGWQIFNTVLCGVAASSRLNIVCMYVCMYDHNIHTHIPCMRIYAHTNMYIQTYLYTGTYWYMHAYIHTSTYHAYIDKHIHTHTHVYIHTCTRRQTNMHTHT